MSCEYAILDGAYLLGALAPGERQEFERHLPGCAECSRAVGELAGLPGLLARVAPEDLGTTSDVPMPETLLPALVREARRTSTSTTAISWKSSAACGTPRPSSRSLWTSVPSCRACRCRSLLGASRRQPEPVPASRSFRKLKHEQGIRQARRR